jgi:hypothetical protein
MDQRRGDAEYVGRINLFPDEQRDDGYNGKIRKTKTAVYNIRGIAE